MTTLSFVIFLWIGSLVAGLLGALTGLGGGVVIVPLLVFGFGVDIRYAMGASLISVIATSSGASAAYVKEGYSNLRIGMFLEIATTLGALFGAYLAVRLRSGVNFTHFLQKWPKIQHSSPKCLQQSMTFQKSSFSWPAVLAYEFDGVSHPPAFG